MTAASDTKTDTQVYCVYIRTTPQAIWDAITSPEWTHRYGYGGYVEYEPELKPGATYRVMADERMKEGARQMGFPVPDVVVDGEIIETDPPRRLVQTFRMAMDPEMKGEGFTRLTYQIDEGRGGVCKLTVLHELEGAPRLSLAVSGGMEEQGGGGGWFWTLSDLKSLLETGSRMDTTDAADQA